MITIISILLVFLNILGSFAPTVALARAPLASQDPDVNLRDFRGWELTNPPYPNPERVGTGDDDKVLINVPGPTDPLSPQLSTLFGGVNTNPTITDLYQVYQWNFASGTRGPLIEADYSGNWGVTMMGIGGGGDVKVPISGYEIAEGYQVLVLYASDSDMTIKYTLEDNVVYGYTLHLVNFNVEPALKTLYDENEAAGRQELIALPCGYKLGTTSGKVDVAIRDTGSIIDPRIIKDWWHEPVKSSCPNLPPKKIKPGEAGKLRTSQRPKKVNVPCERVSNDEFHPLRPYPGSPCDPLIPRSKPNANSNAVIPKSTDSLQSQLDKDYQMRNSVAFSCGNSLTPNSAEVFDSTSLAIPNGCRREGNTVICAIPERFAMTLDLSNAQIPILGNTQIEGMTDAEKMNEYLSWYLNGTNDQRGLLSQTSSDKLVNYSGPLNKLLPYEFIKLVKEALRTGPVAKPAPEGQYHNYLVEDTLGIRLTSPLAGFLTQLFKNVPFSSLEDTAGEVVITVARTTAAQQQDEDVLKGDSAEGALPLKLTIKAKP